MIKEIEIPEGYEARIEGNKVLLELKESEDERILNALITHISIYEGDFTTVGVTRLEMLDWLEKQKEQNIVECGALHEAFVNSKRDYTLEEKCDASDYANTILPTSVTYGENDEEYKLHKIIEAAFIAGQQKEQQTAEWSEEDEKMLNDILTCGERHCYLDVGNIAWLKSLPGRFNLQPKAEWSEEDDFMATTVENSYYCHCGKMTDRLSEQYKKFFEKVKSLRPYPRWKPSEEQMDALYYAKQFDYGGYKAALASLYEQLKMM